MFGQPGETFDDFFYSLQVALTSINCKDPVPYDASVMPLSTFPGTEIYRYAKQHGYFTNDEDYWSKYGGIYRVSFNMNEYTNEAIDEVVDIVKTIYQWKYHQTMADYLLDSLLDLRSSYREYQTLPRSDKENLRRFLERCLNDLIQHTSELL
jgi:tRNA(Ile)-lysidine synthase TilS/MesJ